MAKASALWPFVQVLTNVPLAIQPEKSPSQFLSVLRASCLLKIAVHTGTIGHILLSQLFSLTPSGASKSGEKVTKGFSESDRLEAGGFRPKNGNQFARSINISINK